MAKTNGAKAEQESGAKSTLPLFFQSPMALSLERHSEAGIRPVESFDFAAGANSVPLGAIEFLEAAKFYPIAFTQADPVIPVAIVGMEQQNAFVDENGRWLANTYIPAYVRKYPFIFFELPEKEELVLCIDEASPHFVQDAEGDATRLYDGDQPSEMAKNALNFCAAFQEQFNHSRRFCQKLQEMDLLKPHQSSANLASGKTMRLSGFQLIDPEKLVKLSDEQIVELHKSEFLPLIYYAIQSGSNWQRLMSLLE